MEHLVISQMNNKRREKPKLEESRTIESQEPQAEDEKSTEALNHPRQTAEEIIGKAQEKEQSDFNGKQDVNEKPELKPQKSVYKTI